MINFKNLELILGMVLGLVIIAVLLITILFYVEHRLARKKSKTKHNDSKREGRFLKRYVPNYLEEKYHEKTNSNLVKEQRLSSFLILSSLVLVILGVTIFGFGRFFQINIQDSKINPENIESYNWNKVTNVGTVTLDKTIDYLRKDGVVLYSNRNFKTPTGDHLTDRGMQHWKSWTNQNTVQYYICNNLKCISRYKESVVIIMPGAIISEKDISQLVTKSRKIILYGPTAEVFKREFKVFDIKFVVDRVSQDEALIVKGDQKTTLGLSAGKIFHLPPVSSEYRAYAESSDAFSWQYDGSILSNSLSTRIYSKSIKDGRFVWLDFDPTKQESNELLGGIFGFLYRIESATLSHWPNDIESIILLTIQTELNLDEGKAFIKHFTDQKLPVTYFMLTNDSKKYKKTILDIFKYGAEIACHGDDHQRFSSTNINEQIIRLNKCKIALQEITGHYPKSFRTPEDMFDLSILDSVKNSGFMNLYAMNSSDQASPLIFEDNGKGVRIVSLGQITTDDYLFFNNKNISNINFKDRVLLDSKYMHSIGGVYVHSMHSQFFKMNGYFEAVDRLVSGVGNKQKFMTFSELASWWENRHKALLKLKDSKDPNIQEYKNMGFTVIRLSSKGVIEKL